VIDGDLGHLPGFVPKVWDRCCAWLRLLGFVCCFAKCRGQVYGFMCGWAGLAALICQLRVLRLHYSTMVEPILLVDTVLFQLYARSVLLCGFVLARNVLLFWQRKSVRRSNDDYDWPAVEVGGGGILEQGYQFTPSPKLFSLLCQPLAGHIYILLQCLAFLFLVVFASNDMPAVYTFWD